MTIVDWILFGGLALVAVISAVAMVVSRKAVYSALFLVLNFLAVAVIYLLLNAAFIAVIQVTVYAGAIMVLFLFVIMLLGSEQAAVGRDVPNQTWMAVVLGLALAGLLVFAFINQGDLGTSLPAVGEGFGSPGSVGEALFKEYLIPFEITSILLLAAMVGAIVLTRNRREEKQ